MRKSSKGKAFAVILLVIAVIAGLGYVAVDGGRFKAKNIKQGLDLRGGASITYQAVGDVTEQQLEDARMKLFERVQVYSTEAQVYVEGNNRIAVDVPDVTDDTELFKNLAQVGTIEFKTQDGEVVITGSDIANAEALVDQSSVGAKSYQVKLTMNAEGQSKFAAATQANIGKPISIVYNDNVISSPTVQTAITGGEAYITGSFTLEDASELASYIRIGALPVELEAIRSTSVGAQLGAEALNKSLMAALVGFIIVIIFMIVIYRIPGLAACLALAVYTELVVLLLNVLEITLTLPGIAGIILSIGMAVDANVIIFTRIKEEILAGKPVNSAIRIGFEKAMSAILDGNITTFIAAVVLGMLGSGTVKGFAYTLGLGTLVSLFSAIVVTKYILWAFYDMGIQDAKFYSNKFTMKYLHVVENRKKFFTVSGVIIAIGIVCMAVSYKDSGKIFAYSLDFVGGTQLEVSFDKDEKLPQNKDIEKTLQDEISLASSVAKNINDNTIIIKVKDLSKDLETREKIDTVLKKAYDINPEDIQEETISATVSGEMKAAAVKAVIVAVIMMLIYIWFRFSKLSFALGSVIPLIHDVLIVLSAYAITQYTVGNTFIACLLTILGYSINATIVIFDRIRESKAAAKTSEEKIRLINECITQTFTRSINTSLTTFIMVFCLYIFGVQSIKEFTLPMMVGIVFGAYSSVCIAGTVWYVLDGKIKEKPKSKEEQKLEKKIKDSKDKILV
ncbi:MAG: protein translocase subunit SecD [Lachnospiraceae bacterium]|nr:protein translocase subunit SecD [Lachnospiraceae bacterium]